MKNLIVVMFLALTIGGACQALAVMGTTQTNLNLILK